MLDKILSQDALLAERARLRVAGKTLVFTNGVFDLLHPGHIKVLAEARGVSLDDISRQTSENFFRLFSKVPPADAAA